MTAFSKLIKGRKAFLFDVDGTLVDSNDLHAEAWAKALNHFGKAFSSKDIRPWVGMGGDKLLKDLVGIDDKGPEGVAISKHRADLFKEQYAARIASFPESKTLIQELRRRGFITAIATSAATDELQAILRSAGLENCVDYQTSSDDAKESKPDPDIIQAAVRKIKVSPTDAIMIGDTPYDVEASLAAGVDVIAVRSGGWSDAALKGAQFIVDDVSALYSLLKDS